MPRLDSAIAWTLPRAGSATSAEMGRMGLCRTAYRVIAVDLLTLVILQQGNVWIAKADELESTAKSRLSATFLKLIWREKAGTTLGEVKN